MQDSRLRVVQVRVDHEGQPSGAYGSGADYNVTNTKTVWSDTRTHYTNPGWRWLVMNDLQAGTLFDGTAQEWKHSDCEATYYYQNGTNPVGYQRQYGNLSYKETLPTLDADLMAATENIASGRFYAKASQVLTTVQGGVVLGELRKTARMIRNPLLALRDGVKSFKNTLKERFLRTPKRLRHRVVSDTYLEYVYGWRPLIYDIQGGCEAAKRIFDRPPSVTVFHRQRGLKSGNSELGTEGYTVSGLRYRTVRLTHYEASVTYLASVRLQFNGYPASMVDLGFTPWNIIPTAWELVPWSFMVDYFSNVGDVLTALTFPSTAMRWGITSRRQSATRQIIGIWIDEATAKSTVTPSRYRGCSVQGCQSGVIRRSEVSRRLDTPSLPTLHMKLGGNIRHVLNIGALAAARVPPHR